MIATPPPAEPQFISITAILFSPEAGSYFNDSRVAISYTFPLDRWSTTTVHCRPTSRSSHGMCPTPILQMFFSDGMTEGIVLTQGLNGENLRFPLHLWYSPTALQRNSPVNRSIYNITCGSASKAWCGPVVVLKFNGSRRQGYTDASPNDLPALSAYFLAYK